MQFGKSTFNQALSPDPQHWRLPLLVKNQSSLVSEQSQIGFGLPQWNVPAWKGSIYPKDLPQQAYLEYYVQHFDCVELNSTFYHIPKSSTLLKWKETIHCHNPNFKFLPKIPKAISHERKLSMADPLMHEFKKAMDLLSPFASQCFLQLPPDFSTEYFKDLERFLKQHANEINLMVEFRHPSWFKNNQLRLRAWQLLEYFKAATVVSDTPLERELVHCSFFPQSAMIRFLGIENQPELNRLRLNQWQSKIQECLSNGISNLYFLFHLPNNDDISQLLQLSNQLQMTDVMICDDDCNTKKADQLQMGLFEEQEGI